jgi:hypothetical protein
LLILLILSKTLPHPVPPANPVILSKKPPPAP